ncbi:putative GPI-anchored serine rich tenascin-like glycoprotein [Phytophthora palmivora]|uniref:GPI-anchored serine rich tenascin-like glycoprotein n=1 Tax=Phytophthora palmivora TaxID=4796 RepID=A0A2P4XAR7_9STRA|nr:putative GPI-anchored serine rich tenascin-like glycoprotein [Phytophthora palmivora]
MTAFRVLEVFIAAVVTGATADDDHPYYCTSDAYCEKNYPGTVCISVDNYGDVISKCTPNTSKRPACRGVQPGLCPSYQSVDQGYLNAHCVFVSEENLSLSSSGSDSIRRRLASFSSSASAVASSESSTSASATSSSNSASSKTSNTDDSSSMSNSSSSGAGALYTATIDGEEVIGQFVCLDVSDCENKAADPSTCYPSACGSSDSKEQCTYQGTCTYKNKKKITKRTCMCYAGFEGDKCSTEVSNACDVDCDTGGDCVDNECVCKEGFDGKEHDGKQGRTADAVTLQTPKLLVLASALITLVLTNFAV